MTHPLIEQLLEPGRSFHEAREDFAEIYHQSDDQAVMEAAGELAEWLRQETDLPLCSLPLEVRKRMAEASVAIYQLSSRYRATLECLKAARR